MEPSSAPPSQATSDLREEYFKVIDILQSYDPYFLTIKNWGVTATGAIAAVGFANKAPVLLLLMSVIASGFWITEVMFKLLQLGHTQRAAELEHALRDGSTKHNHPRIMAAFAEQSSQNRYRGRWRSVLLWPQVMFPHVVFVVAGPIAYVVALYFAP